MQLIQQASFLLDQLPLARLNEDITLYLVLVLKTSPTWLHAGLKIVYGQYCESDTGRFSVLLVVR